MVTRTGLELASGRIIANLWGPTRPVRRALYLATRLKAPKKTAVARPLVCKLVCTGVLIIIAIAAGVVKSFL